MSLINISSTTSWFDRFPTEIIFTIFDYLSNNHIIYAFFYFNKRFNDLLLQNQRYLKYLDLPTTDLNTWKTILQIIGSQIELLTINTMDLSFPLTYFPNIKSIIIFTSHGYPNEQLKSIFESDQFNNLHTFKIKEEEFLSYPTNNIYLNNNPNYVFEKILNHQNSLQAFQYSLEVPLFKQTFIDNFETNSNLHSLTLILFDFQDIFSLFEYTPNLEYLNLRIKSSSGYGINPINSVQMKLKQLYLTLISEPYTEINSSLLISCIQQFRSSLTCLLLNLVDVNIRDTNEFPLNSLNLQQFLESMKVLKQFHLYAKIHKNRFDINNDNILSRFQNQFWFDKNLLFGMHENYFYTLPFQFGYLHDFPCDFSYVKLNNPEILINNPRIWYNVKSIELQAKRTYDSTFIKQLKMKMPKLISIQFFDYRSSLIVKTKDSCISEHTTENFDITLDNVKTIECTTGTVKIMKEFIIYALPNLEHLILCPRDLLEIDSQLIAILSKRIRRLDVKVYSTLESLIEIDYVCFSNVQHICFGFESVPNRSQEHADMIMRMLNNFKNLKTLTIYILRRSRDSEFPIITEWNDLIGCLRLNEIVKNYQVRNLQRDLLFSKKLV